MTRTEHLLVILALDALLLVGCESKQDRQLAIAQEGARGTLRAARCDYDSTLVERPAVQEQCNEVRRLCNDGPAPELRATATQCAAATAALVTVSQQPAPARSPSPGHTP